eukprot:TRINITY_DN5063_c0_g1_i3.p1 TRINITY_DN5063_c0_g1~~TRINITY_DN5063_c0_g1_i3.p1  ORF type:complete len:492 (+),score=118.46 TRINITY_DN5063_c0_g1_i3:131-1606(+)
MNVTIDAQANSQISDRIASKENMGNNTPTTPRRFKGVDISKSSQKPDEEWPSASQILLSVSPEKISEAIVSTSTVSIPEPDCPKIPETEIGWTLEKENVVISKIQSLRDQLTLAEKELQELRQTKPKPAQAKTKTKAKTQLKTASKAQPNTPSKAQAKTQSQGKSTSKPAPILLDISQDLDATPSPKKSKAKKKKLEVEIDDDDKTVIKVDTIKVDNDTSDRNMQGDSDYCESDDDKSASDADDLPSYPPFREEDIRTWSAARVAAWNSRRTSPDGYYYRFNDIGIPPEKRRGWTPEEHQTYIKRMMEFSENGLVMGSLWGLFSKVFRIRCGYTCANYYRKMVQKGELKDATYAIKEDGKLCKLSREKNSTSNNLKNELNEDHWRKHHRLEKQIDKWVQQYHSGIKTKTKTKSKSKTDSKARRGTKRKAITQSPLQPSDPKKIRVLRSSAFRPSWTAEDTDDPIQDSSDDDFRPVKKPKLSKAKLTNKGWC